MTWRLRGLRSDWTKRATGAQRHQAGRESGSLEKEAEENVIDVDLEHLWGEGSGPSKTADEEIEERRRAKR